MDFHQRFVNFLPELKAALTVPGTTEWSVKGFIDTYRNIYSITADTKVISKVIELMIFPCLLRFAEKNNLTIQLPPHQNYYPDVTFIDHEGNKYAIDLKTTYRMTDDVVNGMTLGAFTGYFRNRMSKKNVLYPYGQYKKHYVLGVIYSRSDIDSITRLLKKNGFILTTTKRKLLINYMNNANDDNWSMLACCYPENISTFRSQIDSYLNDELRSYNLDNFEEIVSVARDFDFFFQEKWRLAADRPGSGNTKNIGSETRIKNLKQGNGLFYRTYGENGEAEFDKYWMQYQTKDMATLLGQDAPVYKNLTTFQQWVLSLQNPNLSGQ